MKLVPLLDHSGNVKAWANPKSGWNWVGNVFALIAFDGVFNLAGSQIGWWFGDHLRDRYGRVVLSRRSTKIDGLNMPRSEKIPEPPKVNLPSGHPELRWLLPPPEAKRIIIFGDNDPSYAGQAAAYALARRLRSDERVVEVQIPAEVGADWNDVHQLRRHHVAGAHHG